MSATRLAAAAVLLLAACREREPPLPPCDDYAAFEAACPVPLDAPGCADRTDALRRCVGELPFDGNCARYRAALTRCRIKTGG